VCPSEPRHQLVRIEKYPTIELFDTVNHENNQTKYPANQFFSILLEHQHTFFAPVE
jgi:hypothetical protein